VLIESNYRISNLDVEEEQKEAIGVVRGVAFNE